MATTRLRKTFHYPADSDSDDPPDLDEEHQQTLLSSLATQDETTSTLYRHLFLALPILTSLSYIPSLFKATSTPASTAAGELFVRILSIAVPALAAYILYYHPITAPGNHGLRSLDSRSSGKSTAQPHERHLIILGAGLAGILSILAAGNWWQSSDAWAFLPAVVYVLTLFVRQQLAPVDLEELRKARYELKGA